MKVIFASAECYPVAKVGGLADVVGSLPKYLIRQGVMTSVVIPGYQMPWFEGKTYRVVHYGHYHHAGETIHFEVRYFVDDPLGFPFYTIHIPGKFDRFGVYAGSDGYFFGDEVERLIAFQRCLLMWLRDNPDYRPDVMHCHDHHTGLIPFMMQYAFEFEQLKHIPTVFTIHNERYQGSFGWIKKFLLPDFDSWKSGLLDWNNRINPLASAVKVAYKVTTVSPNYMQELMSHAYGLETLFRQEQWKCRGILNGIDHDVWDPARDPMIGSHYSGDIRQYKRDNKILLCKKANLNPDLPLFGFIGRLVQEKGAEFIAGIIDNWMTYHHRSANFIILGTGEKDIENALFHVAQKYPENVGAMLAYDEALAHQIYASADFLLMPSRVEPCGLNQLFAMRYGTLPIVRSVGGLVDTVTDIAQPGGVGIRIDQMHFSAIMNGVWRASEFYRDNDQYYTAVQRAMELDFSWNQAAGQYVETYRSVL